MLVFDGATTADQGSRSGARNDCVFQTSLSSIFVYRQSDQTQKPSIAVYQSPTSRLQTADCIFGSIPTACSVSLPPLSKSSLRCLISTVLRVSRDSLILYPPVHILPCVATKPMLLFVPRSTLLTTGCHKEKA